MQDISYGEWTNVEGIAAEMASRFPYEDPQACRDIVKLVTIHVEAGLASRHAREQRDLSSPT